MAEDLERREVMMHQRNSKGVYPVQAATSPMYISTERQQVSLLVPLIVVVNVAMFVLLMGINNCPRNTPDDRCFAKFLRRFSFQPLSENPLLGPSSRTLLKLGALDANKVVHEHQGWRLITCIWLHAGVIHLLVNMLSLLFIGIKLEKEFGIWRIGILYMLSGLGGSLLSALFIRNAISVGASGALFGMLGAMLSELITNWSMYSNKCAAFMTLMLVVAINLALGILPHVDNFAHIGGFVSGYLAGFVLLLQPRAGWTRRGSNAESSLLRKHKVSQYMFLVTALIVLIVGFTVAMVLLLRGVDGNKNCSWCHYLTCLPTSKWKC